MDRKRRFFIFLSSAGLMSIFLLFTLSFRQDNPLKAWFAWLPEPRVISMITEHVSADGERRPKVISFSDDAKKALDEYSLTELEVIHSIRDADVLFSHDSTLVNENPKKYVVQIEVDLTPYYLQVQLEKRYTLVNYLSKREQLK